MESENVPKRLPHNLKRKLNEISESSGTKSSKKKKNDDDISFVGKVRELKYRFLWAISYAIELNECEKCSKS